MRLSFFLLWHRYTYCAPKPHCTHI